MIKILIADDEPMEREILSDIIRWNFAHQAQVRQAENGRAAVDTACLWGADLLLLDIEMPGMNGIEAARVILQQRPQCRVIFVTAYSLFSYAQEAVRLGARDYILKPAEEETVVRAVQAAMDCIDAEARLEQLARQEQQERQQQPDPASAPTDKTGQLMRQVREYLDKNYMYNISQESVSGILDFTPSYFSKLFKAHFGMTFMEYLTDLRIHAAQELLRDPMKSMTEVAGMVGYEDANYFAKAFKKKTGMTTTQYRRGGC